jgi:hypothetical protein
MKASCVVACLKILKFLETCGYGFPSCLVVSAKTHPGNRCMPSILYALPKMTYRDGRYVLSSWKDEKFMS